MKKMLKVNMLRLLLGMSTLVFFGISGSFTAYAGDTPAAPQQHKRVVKGRVTDKKTGEPIVGATVWFKESTSGTATDAAGNYSLNRPQGNAILSVSFIGYKSQEVVLGKEDVINFQLEETSEMIEEAVVVGYGSQRKESVIGAITTVGVAELKQPTGQISNSLAGRLAGVVAVQRSGEPGQSSEFWIRGISTFGANKDPLILVDGVERSLDLLDPEDIESFSILKDATATAVYGVRGANGVIIVNTRRGKEGRPDINVKAQVGILTPTKVPKMANSATWAEMYNVARTSHDKAPLYTPEEIQKYKDHSDPYLYPDIDWLDALMKNHTTQQRVNLNVTGGGSIARYYISGAFFNENGLFISDPEHEWDSRINYKRYNFTSNVDVNLHPTTILKLNIGNPAPFGFRTPDEVIYDMSQQLSDCEGYSPSQGLFSARKAIMQYSQIKKLPNVTINDIYTGNGVSELINLCMSALLDNGDEILIPSPDYPLWTACATLAGGKAVHYICDEQSDWYPDIEDMRRKITDHTKALVIINPNNPTGALYPKEVLQKIVDLAREHHLIIFSDEIYDRLVMDGKEHISIASLAPDLFCVTFSGLSKSHMIAGFRIGWMVLSGNKAIAKDYIEGIKMLSNMRLCSNVPAQSVVQTALWGNQSVNDYLVPGGRIYEQREYIYKALTDIPGITAVKPQAAFYMFPKIDVKKFNIVNDEKFALDLLQDKKILIVQGSGFNWKQPDHFRVVYLPRIEVLKEAVGKISDFLSYYRQG